MALYTYKCEIQFGADDMKEAREYIDKLMKNDRSKMGYFKRTEL